ncbi:MAG: hypothetical protein IT516_18020 [Burkholderiales bacterium]|nr:hypothetical protein [Burkholderiales bacterium]
MIPSSFTLPRLRAAALWVLSLGLVFGVAGWQTFARAVTATPEAASPKPAPAPFSLALLPEYRPGAVTPIGDDIVQRPAFNPTRRPAPPVAAAAEAAKPKMQRGQFALSGTMQIDGKMTAFLREVQGGKSRRVHPGETLNGMVVAEINPDRVRLTLGDESEELLLKVAAGPKRTIQPAVAAVGRSPVAAAAPAAGATPATAATRPRDVAEVLAERRRLARAQELAAQGVPPGAPLPQPGTSAAPVEAPGTPPVPRGDMGSNDPRWQEVYQRYQMPRR